MIAKPPVTSVELASRPSPPASRRRSFENRLGRRFRKRRCFTLEKRLISQKIFRKQHAREAFNCDYFETILSGEA